MIWPIETLSNYDCEKKKWEPVFLIDSDSDDEDEEGKDDNSSVCVKVFAPQTGYQCCVQPQQHPQFSSGRTKPFVQKTINLASIIIHDQVVGLKKHLDRNRYNDVGLRAH